MTIRHQDVTVTTDGSGFGSATTRRPISGELRRISVGAQFGTARVTLQPQGEGYSPGFGTANGVFVGSARNRSLPAPFPVIDGYIKVGVNGGGATKTDIVRILYQDFTD